MYSRGLTQPRITSAAFSAIMITGALMLTPTRSGITEASTTRSPSIPKTCNPLWTTPLSTLSVPILQVPSGSRQRSGSESKTTGDRINAQSDDQPWLRPKRPLIASTTRRAVIAMRATYWNSRAA